MPRKPNTLLRIAVPGLMLLGAIGFAIAVGVNSARQTGTQQQTAETPAETGPVEPAQPGDASPSAQPAPPADPASPPAPSTELSQLPVADAPPEPGPGGAQPTTPSIVPEGLVARRLAEADAPLAPLGTLDEASDFAGTIEFSPRGAGIKSLKLNRYYNTIESREHVELQSERFVVLDNGRRRYAVPFASLGIFVGDTYVDLASPGIWRQDPADPGRFEAIIEDATGAEVLRLERIFAYPPGSFDLELRQRAINLAGAPLTVRWVQTGPADLAKPESKYGGDKRRVRFGYLLSPERQAGSLAVTPDTELAARVKILGERSEAGAYPIERPLWPTADARQKGHRLVWAAFTNRYFAVAVHTLFDPASTRAEDRLLEGDATLDRLVLNPFARPEDTVVVTRITSAPETIAPTQAFHADLAVYAGPLLKSIIAANPVAQAVNLEGLVVYNYGGFCGELCTFGWLTHVLLAVLRFFHTLTLDWALAIILLVVVVRTVLHPITKFSQVRMRRFGAQMQAAQPKMKKLQERYKPLDTDPPDEKKRKQQKLQGEMAKLWKEEGLNPAGALGCLPMFLQSPVWIALWATLYFAAELRHEPAFWGVFQTLTGGDWKFLGDLASPDKAIPLGPLAFTPPFIGAYYGRIESINLLPFILGIVFYVQQKYLTPPPTATMSPEQEQMQKTMRVMTVVMFPLFMYPAPSGLALYFITNSALGILEYKWIYHEAEKKGLLDPDKIREERAQRQASGKPGFLARLRAAAEEQQRRREQNQAGPGKRVVRNTAPAKKDLPKRYKKR